MTGTSVIVNLWGEPIRECSAVKLARYAQLVGYDENPFWGINHNVGDNVCRYIWTYADRLLVAKYLCEAQVELEAELNFLIGYQWTEELKKDLKCPMFTQYGYVVEFGVEKIVSISTGETIDFTSDPTVIGPIATTVTDPGEIVVYHPGTDIEITPSKVTISGGNVTIEIPRCRLVQLQYVDNPDVGWQYSQFATWAEDEVDVSQRFNDTSTQGIMLSNHTCSPSCAVTGCSDQLQTACGYVRNPEVGIVELHPANYSGGVWSKVNPCSCGYKYAKLYYLSGMPLTKQTEDMIVRLAHSKMPKEPCGCDPLKNMWAADRAMPEVFSRERINCPFGMSAGAWVSWKWALGLKLVRGGIVG